MLSRRKQFAVVAIAAVAFGLLVDGASAAYTFGKIVDTTTTTPFGAFSHFDAPAISGDIVAFEGDYGGKGIFTGNGGPLTTIATLGGSVPGGIVNSFVSGPTISDGEVAIIADTSAPSGRTLYVGSGGSLSIFANAGEASPLGPIAIGPQPVISHGTVVFNADTVPSGLAIFSSSGGPLTTIAKLHDPGPTGPIGGPCCVSASGSNVSFIVPGVPSNLYRSTNGQLTLIAKSGDMSPSGVISRIPVQLPSISGDVVAFTAALANDNSGIFMGNGGPLTQIFVTNSTPHYTVLSPPSVAGSMVAFQGSDGLDISAIYIYDSGALTKVIQSGDNLFGQTVTRVGMGSFALDPEGSGRIAFSYSLSDSTRGIGVAIPIPEPSALGLSVLAFGFAFIFYSSFSRD